MQIWNILLASRADRKWPEESGAISCPCTAQLKIVPTVVAKSNLGTRRSQKTKSATLRNSWANRT